MATPPVTNREAEVLALLGDRLSNAQIAHRLHISVRTVEHHVSALLRKSGVANRQDLVNSAGWGTEVAAGRLAGLPTAQTSLVGRIADQQLIGAAIERARLVTLLGPGGVGKTRLAMAVAAAAAPTFGNAGGFVDLASVRDYALPAVAATLRVAPQSQQPLLDTIAEFLGDRPALLVLDSCEHLLDAAAELVARVLAACPATAVLATSRERLRVPGEYTVPVDPLPLRDDAVTLFRNRALAVDPRFSAEDATIAQICARLDGMPLAIELAAARAPALGAEGLLTALDDLVRVLAGSRSPDPRHRSLRAVIDWSHQLLDDSERRLFRRLAVFAGAFDLPAATAVADLGEAADIADVLGRLVEKNLVVYQPQHARWRLLDTVRAYARHQLAAADDQAPAERRRRSWAHGVATALGQRLEDDWPTRFDAVIDDLRAGLRDLPSGPERTAHGLARSLGHLCYARRFRQEAVDRYRQAARHATTTADAASDLRAASDCAAAIYRADLAYDLALAAADKAGQSGDDRARAEALARAVAIACRFSARMEVQIPDDRLRELHQEALSLADPEDSSITAAISVASAWIAESGRIDAALADQALAAAKTAGDPVLVWAAIDAVTTVYEQRGDLRRAYRLARTGLPLLRELDRDDPSTGETVNSIHHLNAIYATACGEFRDAIDIAHGASADSVAAEPISLGSMLVPPLVLTGEFEEALYYAEAMWRGWQSSGRATAGWLWFPTATAALARGLSGDQQGFRLWRDRMAELAGPRNAFRLHTASSAHFVDARIAVHTADLTDAPAIVEAAFSSVVPGHRYRVFALAAAAELAVLAGLPDTLRYLDAAAELAPQNGWATACLARARGRYANDLDALRESMTAWENVGGQFERGYTLELLSTATA